MALDVPCKNVAEHLARLKSLLEILVARLILLRKQQHDGQAAIKGSSPSWNGFPANPAVSTVASFDPTG